MRSMRMLASQLHVSSRVNRDAFVILLQASTVFILLFIIFRLENTGTLRKYYLYANTCFVIVTLTVSSLLASFNAMTSTGEDSQPNTETIAAVRLPGENLGPLGQITVPPGQELNIQAAFVKLSADFGKLTTHLGRICEYLPIHDARENRDLPGSVTKGRKRRHSVSSSDFEEDSATRHKTSKDDVDAISITASDEDVNELLCNSNEQGATTDAQTDVNDELLTELSAGLLDDEKKGPKITTQLAAIVNKLGSTK